MVRVSQHWYGGVSEGPLKISEASANLLVSPPSAERIRLLGSHNVSDTWKRFFEGLLSDPAADFAKITDDNLGSAQAAE